MNWQKYGRKSTFFILVCQAVMPTYYDPIQFFW
jgi:hypothetical protein